MEKSPIYVALFRCTNRKFADIKILSTYSAYKVSYDEVIKLEVLMTKF